MNDKATLDPGQRRTRRPDLAAAAEPKTLGEGAAAAPDAEVTAPDGPAVASGDLDPADQGETTGGEEDVADASEQAGVTEDKVTVRSDFIEGSGPYQAKGVQVVDAGGRQVCMVASGHLTPEKRHERAAWIAQKLNG